MKRFYIQLLGVAGLTVMSAAVCKAQTPGALALKSPTGTVTIDGSGAEWGDSLSYYNKDTKIHYAISNDKANLYLIVKTKDPIQQGNILNNGLSFSVDMKGRKKNTLLTTWPTPVQGGMGGGKPGETIEQKRLAASVTKFKKITVDGYKDISDETITTTNAYGIKTAIGYEDDGSLVYEEAIPLELFHAGDLVKNEWSFNIKLNGHDSSSDNSNSGAAPADLSGGKSGGRGIPKHADATASNAFFNSAHASTPTIDFWGKFTLAQ